MRCLIKKYMSEQEIASHMTISCCTICFSYMNRLNLPALFQMITLWSSHAHGKRFFENIEFLCL